MKLRNVRLFTIRLVVDVADHRSVSLAGVKNNIVQPGVTKQICNLEALLGFELFERSESKRRITGVTDRGKPVVEHFRRVLDTIEELEEGEIDEPVE